MVGIWHLLIFNSVVQDINEKCSNFNKKVPPVNSVELAHLKNIESPVSTDIDN